MGLCGASCRAGAGGTLNRAKVEPLGFREAFEPRQNITCRAHISRFLLYPDNLPRVGMLVDAGCNFRARPRCELIRKQICSILLLPAPRSPPPRVPSHPP